MEDERFKHIATDPKFRRIPKKVQKVKIDKRFHGMFNDEKFKVKYTVDKRGRPVNYSSANDLKRYYDISSESESSDSENEQIGKFVRPPKHENDSDLTLKHKDDEPVANDFKQKLKDLSVDYARGEANLNSESSSDEETDDNEEDSDIEHDWGELDKDAERTDEVTHRLAICNMDWDRIRAVDLMVLFNSFLPPGGLIHSITIYPSEFGLKRMQEEEVKGPTELVEYNTELEVTEDNEEGSRYHMEKLRQYQLNRLKYYYGVVVFDNPDSANKIYTECDGLEYESSATKMDLRFIPDDTSFDEAPKEVCDKLPDMIKYQPRFFMTTALQQAKVELTWDETNPKRVEIAKKLADGKVDEVTEEDLEAYLASSGSESEEERDNSDITSDNEQDGNPINKYKALLADLEKNKESKNKNDVEMEVTWGLNVKENTEKLVKKKLEENEEKTPFQKYLEKRKENRKLKREQKKQHKNSDNDESEMDSDMDFDMNDPYFAEEFQNSEFKSKKKQSNKNKQEEESEETKEQKAKLELLLLDNDDGRKHFSLKNIEKESNQNSKQKKKNKKERGNIVQTDENDFEINVKDARFSAIFNSHHYNIDPTDSRFRKTKAMDAFLEEKQKRIVQNDDEMVVQPSPSKKAKHSELKALVNSVKRKTKNLINKK